MPGLWLERSARGDGEGQGGELHRAGGRAAVLHRHPGGGAHRARWWTPAEATEADFTALGD